MPTLQSLVRLYGRRMESIAQESCSVLSKNVSDKTPVDTTSAKRSWRATNGAPSGLNVDIARSGRSGLTRNTTVGFPSESNVGIVSRSIRLGDHYSYANARPYIRKLEYNHPSNGMVRSSVPKWNSIARKAASKALRIR